MIQPLQYASKGDGFDPKLLTVVGLTEHDMLGKAMNIMLKALGFGMVQISPLKDVCVFGGGLKPAFVLFAPEYLSLTQEERLNCLCPCDKRQNCNYTLAVVFLKQRSFENVLKSKEMGFDGIIFADEPLAKIYASLKRIFEQKYTFKA